MLKKILFIFVATALNAMAFGQSFEGKIIYKNSYKSKIPNMTDEQFTGMMGAQQEYVIKGANYKSIMDGTLVQWQMYLPQDNRLYTKMSNSQGIFYNDASVNNDEVIKAEINKGVADILGYKCDELILTCKSGIQKYYYNPELKLDGALFKDHRFGNWYEVLSRTNAVPLKMTIDTPQFAVETVATEIKKEPVDVSVFTLPADAQIQKSPY